jgi:tetratricopeptide (TPR) repeat protein
MAGEASLQLQMNEPRVPRTRRLSSVCRNAIRAGMWMVICAGLALGQPGAAQADPIKASATLTSPNNAYARLLLQFGEEVPTEVTMAGAILVIRFAKPVDISVDDLGDALPAYVGSARRDPDGSAIRLALTQMVKVNTMTAGERVFIDLLPEKWVGLPPALPPEVVKELSDRALAAERALRAQKLTEEAKKRPPVRVRTAVQPTFVRFVFELPDGVSVSSSLNADKYTLSFSLPLTFDLADAKVTAPSNVKAISQSTASDTSSVEIGLIGEVDVHGFREDRNYIVDIGFDSQKQSAGLLPAAPSPVKTDSGNAPAAPAPQKSTEASPAKADAPKADASSQDKPADKAVAADAKTPAQPVAEATPSQPAPAVPPPAATPPSPAPSQISAPAAPPVPDDRQAEKQPAAPAVSAAPNAPAKNTGLAVAAKRTSDDLRITFPFGAPTPVALFRRSDAVWLVTADPRSLDLSAVTTEGGSLIADVSAVPVAGGQAIRIKLNRPQLPSLAGDDQNPVLVLSDKEQPSSQSLVAVRNVADPAHANVSIAFAQPGPILRVSDPDVGDTLSVVTGLLPARGFTRRQNFVEFSLLESMQGIVILTNSDDVTLQPSPDKVVLTRPGGLTLSAASIQTERAAKPVGAVFDVADWNDDQAAPFIKRLDDLMTQASMASGDERIPAHITLARFYMARGLYPEAKGILDVALAKPGTSSAIPAALMVRAVAETLAGRPELAMKDLNDPAIGSNFDTQLWKALVSARLGKWAEAREKFKNAEFGVMALPLDLQRILLIDAMQSSLEVKDYSGATARSNDLQTIGVSSSQASALAFLRGRLAEALGRDKDALSNYHDAATSDNRPVAAEAALAEIALRQKRNEISDDEALQNLEIQSVIWRGDALEAKNLQMLSHLYIEKGRFGDALATAIQATKIDPSSDAARTLQDDASALFSQIFLTDKGDVLPPITALGLFYQYRDLTPIGRRGDEMIRRLADRLVAVDLLDQASDLLQYQIEKRLDGAARAQVAARLATIYLMNRKPDRAIAALRSTRIGDLAGEVRQQRLLLESRAQSDVGRYDLALDIISNMTGREAIRLRSDIYWAMRKWRESAEQIEVLYGDRWRDFQPLNDVEKSDIIRATIGYALANDAIGLARFREKYAPKMATDADKSAFAIASQPSSGDSADLERIAKMAATVDTLDGFLREMRNRFPDAMARAKLPPGLGVDSDTTGALPQIVGTKKVSSAN